MSAIWTICCMSILLFRDNSGVTIIVTNLHLLFISTFDLHVSQTKYMDHGKGTNTMVGFLFCFLWGGGEELQPLVINCFSWLAWYILKECVQKSFLFFLPLMEYCPSGLSSASASSASKNNCSVFVWCVRGPNQTDQCKSEWTVLNHLYTQLHNKLLKCTFMFDFCLFVFTWNILWRIYRILNLPLPY